MKTEQSALLTAFSVQAAKRRLDKKTLFVIAAIFLVASALCFSLITGRFKHESAYAEPRALTPVALNGGISQPQTQDSRLSVVGMIEANHTVSVTAPFDATIKEKGFSFDTEVNQGQLLLTLDATDLLHRIEEAKVVMLKAAKIVQELESWETGSEVGRAKRHFVQSQQQVEQTERKVQEAETLLKKGIIPRSEYDGLVEQLNGFKTQLAAASDDLQSTYEKASKGTREIARIEYAQARRKYEDISGSLLLGKVVAPRSGIISKALATSGQAPATLDTGSRITKGQSLFSIALTDKLMVSAKVDEADVADLSPGMKVEISLDSQDIPTIKGRLVQISALAVQSGNSSGSSTFDIKIDILELSAQQRSRLRVGMSCNVAIEKAQGDARTVPVSSNNVAR